MQGDPGATATQLTEATSQHDRRGSRRVAAKLRATLSARGRLFWTRHKAFIVDYSMLGLRVRAEASFTLGRLSELFRKRTPPSGWSAGWCGLDGPGPHRKEKQASHFSISCTEDAP